jgi:aryl-alcohol dehydrogenase-like predicted oxidoreductase
VGEGAIALAWLLKRSPVMLPIPGTGDPAHLDDNMKGARVTLDAEAFERLDRQGREAWKQASAS